jgi:hypothetical protein
MRVFSNQELENIIIDESLLTGISWGGNHFQDVAIQIDWCGQEDLKEEIDFVNSKASLYFEFVTDLEFSIKFKSDTMGVLEITSFSFDLLDEVWAIEFSFKFYPVGYLKFKCNDFKFVVDTNEPLK